MKPIVKQPFVQKLLKSISTKDTLFQQFAEIALARFSDYALSQLSITDLRTVLENSWDFIQQWNREKPKFNLHNVSTLQSQRERGAVIQILIPNMPFVADSILTELRRQQLDINFVLKCSFNTERSPKAIKSIEPNTTKATEMLIHIELRQHVLLDALSEIEQTLTNIVTQITKAVGDFEEMRKMLRNTAPILSAQSNIDEADFITWLSKDSFIFLGALSLTNDKITQAFGVCKDTPISTELLEEIRLTSKLSSKTIWIHKPSYRTVIDRNEPLDVIRIRVSETEELVFIGLLTYAARSVPFKQIPYANSKIAAVETSLKPSAEFNQPLDVLSVINQLPLVEIVNSDTQALIKICQSILNHRSKYVVLTHDRFDANLKQAYLLIFANQEKLTDQHKSNILSIIKSKTNAEILYQDTYLIDNNLNCLYVVLQNSQSISKLTESIASEISQTTLSWEDQLRNELIQKVGVIEADLLSRKYKYTFDTTFKSAYSPALAADDVMNIERVIEKNLDLDVNPKELSANDTQLPGTAFHLRIFKQDTRLVLSDIFAMLKSLNLSLFSESSYPLALGDEKTLWIHDLKIGTDLDIDLNSITAQIREVATKVLLKQHSYDNLNSLSVTRGLYYRQILLIKTFLSYLKQIQLPFGGSYARDILLRNPLTLHIIVQLFEAKFDPKIDPSQRIQLIEDLTNQFNDALAKLITEDEDKLFRHLYNLVTCILRTNFYVVDKTECNKKYISIKIESSSITDIPKPAPMVEIFVYSTDFEAVHLRSGKVARGGLRWSDRGEDYRTEVLGLTKAQNTKNALIVAQGSKGGFYVKEPTPSKETVINCYKNMLRAFLDITDNMVKDHPKTPKNVICYDESDPYFVVAADKGTATFSDIANDVAAEYNFWLKDAFASGGSAGYDHKKMGITSKGAWESVKTHSQEALNINPNEEPISAVGIGDMSGDVFGNGLLSSETIQLKAAFNHKHIFIDPNPNAKESYAERLRLFNLPYSNWSDYNESKLSKGGMIIERSSKSVVLSSEASTLLGLQEDAVKPKDILRAILKLPVDLMWLGGIGTYIKATHETNDEVSDRINDEIRINGKEVNAKIIAEGANLGVTQPARVEFELTQNGRVNTDFIDNSAGVDCSDHEVNIKILLNLVMEKHTMTLDERNILLKDMTSDIARLVTKNNKNQNLAITFAMHISSLYPDELIHLNKFLNNNAGLNNAIEYLPSDTDLLERKKTGKTFTRPEIAVLMSYFKNYFKTEILAQCDLTTESALSYLTDYFPPQLSKYSAEMSKHPLKTDIIATQLSNEIVDHLGLHFINRIMQQTGCSITSIVEAYLTVKAFFDLPKIWRELDASIQSISMHERVDILETISSSVHLACVWILNFLDPSKASESYIQKLNFFLESVQPSEIVLATPNAKALSLNNNNPDLNKAILEIQPRATSIYLSLMQNCLSTTELKQFENNFYALYSKLPFDAIANLLAELKQDNYWQDLFILNKQLDLMRTHVDLTHAITVSILSQKNSLEYILDTHKAKIDWLKHTIDSYGKQPIINPAGITLLARYISNLANAIIAQIEKEF